MAAEPVECLNYATLKEHDGCSQCFAIREQQRAEADAALWAVVDGIARGWRVEDRIATYEAVAKALGGRYESRPGSLYGEFVGLRVRPSGTTKPEAAK